MQRASSPPPPTRTHPPPKQHPFPPSNNQNHPVSQFYGHVSTHQEEGRQVFRWNAGEQVSAVAYDNPIPGFATRNCINLRLWAAKPSAEFDLQAFNTGDYVQVGGVGGFVILKRGGGCCRGLLFTGAAGLRAGTDGSGC
jgi:hypothetical protein